MEYFGQSLDKALGGRAVRSLLGAATTGNTGRLRDVLSVIPFSDKLGITNPEDATSGKELLGFEKNDDSWGAFLGGLGAEILTDPGTYLNPLGLTGKGIAATKAGLLPKVTQPIARESPGVVRGIRNLFTNAPSDFAGSAAAQMRGIADPAAAAAVAAKIPGATAADVVNQPLRSLATFHVPFTDIYHPIGTGATAQNIANNLGSIGDALAYSAPGRAVAPLFDNRLSQFGPAPTTELLQRTTRGKADALTTEKRAIEKLFAETSRHAAEGLGMTDPAQAAVVNPRVTSLLEGAAGPLPASLATPEAQSLVGGIRTMYDRARAKAADVGRAAKEYVSDYGLDYTHRQMTPAGEEVLNAPRAGQFLKPKNAADIARNQLLDLPGGTNAVNALFQDPRAALGTHSMSGLGGQGLPKVGQTLPQAQNHVLQRYFGWTDQKTAEFWSLRKAEQAGQLTPADPQWPAFQLMKKEWDKAADIPGLVSSNIEEPFKKGLAAPGVQPAQLWNDLIAARPAIFADNPVGLAHSYQLGEAASNLGAQGFSEATLAAAKRGGQISGDRVSVAKMLAESGYNNPNMERVLMEDLQARGIVGPNETVKALHDVYVPAAQAQDLARYGKPFERTREIRPIVDVLDSLLNLNKSSQVTTFPFTVPTIMRNALTEAYTNIRQGLFGAGESPLTNLARPAMTASELRSGGAAPGLTKIPMFAGLTPEEATKRFRDIAYWTGTDVPFSQSAKAEVIGRGAHDSGMVGTLGPLAAPQKTLWQMAKEGVLASNPEGRTVGERLNPLAQRGVFGAKETTFAPALAAQEMMHSVDQAGRHAALIGALSQGYEPGPAAELAKWMRMGTEDLTDWERRFAARMIPYYRWLRTATPATLADLAAHPGGLTGQMIRGTNALRQNEGLIPDYVGEGLALPIGGRTDEGHQRYLSGFGLPFEELNRLASMSNSPWKRTAQQLAGNVNPLLKSPIEWMTGTQLYSGRNLDDLYARTGNGTLDQLLSMTPLATPARFASRLFDTRKDPLTNIASVLSPARFTDADMNRALLVQGRKLIEDSMSTNPMIRSFTRPYVPEEFRGQLSPEDERQLALYNALREMARARFR